MVRVPIFGQYRLNKLLFFKTRKKLRITRGSTCESGITSCVSLYLALLPHALPSSAPKSSRSRLSFAIIFGRPKVKPAPSKAKPCPRVTGGAARSTRRRCAAVKVRKMGLVLGAYKKFVYKRAD